MSMLRSNQLCAAVCFSFLVIHVCLLGWSATRHSATLDEPAHLVAGLAHWKFQRFDVYAVNPPLIHWCAAAPVIAIGYNEDWASLADTPGSRHEFALGTDFVRVNGPRTLELLTYARWACIPFSLIGGLFCFLLSSDVWKNQLAGVLSLYLWCFDPNIMAHAEIVGCDCAATSLGLGAAYGYWRWLHGRTWCSAIFAGFVLGLCIATKTTWLVLLGVWPLLWILSFMFNACDSKGFSRSLGFKHEAALQMASILIISIYVVNLCYAFTGCCPRLGSFSFVSRALSGGLSADGMSGNIFESSFLRSVPLPFPEAFITGVDLQLRDFEAFPEPSYLCGRFSRSGWWYYYLVGFGVKLTHGLQVLVFIALFVTVSSIFRRVMIGSRGVLQEVFKLMFLLVPTVVVVSLASSQTGINHHFRYVLPSIGFLLVLSGGAASCLPWWQVNSNEARTQAN